MTKENLREAVHYDHNSTAYKTSNTVQDNFTWNSLRFSIATNKKHGAKGNATMHYAPKLIGFQSESHFMIESWINWAGR